MPLTVRQWDQRKPQTESKKKTGRYKKENWRPTPSGCSSTWQESWSTDRKDIDVKSKDMGL